MRRGWPVLGLVCLGILVLVTGSGHAESTGSIASWGYNHWHQCDVPEPNARFVAIAEGVTCPL
jgi:hypothetical protein